MGREEELCGTNVLIEQRPGYRIVALNARTASMPSRPSGVCRAIDEAEADPIAAPCC